MHRLQHVVRRPRAFTLIEILVVIAIIAMLAVVASVQLARARITANEQLALNSLRLVAKSCQFFYLVATVYPQNLTELGPPTSYPPYVDGTLSTMAPAKQGYTFVYTSAADRLSFTLRANPQNHGVTGVRHFYVDQTLGIHATENNSDAGPSDPPIP